MSDSASTQKKTYPIAAYNFRVTVDEKTIGFSEVSGLAREYETLTYKHGLSYWEGEAITKFRFDKFEQLTLKKAIFPEGDQLYKWLDSMAKKSVSISLCNEIGEAVVSWSVHKAIVTKLEVDSLQANSNEIAIDTITLMASGISVKHH